MIHIRHECEAEGHCPQQEQDAPSPPPAANAIGEHAQEGIVDRIPNPPDGDGPACQIRAEANNVGEEVELIEHHDGDGPAGGQVAETVDDLEAERQACLLRLSELWSLTYASPVLCWIASSPYGRRSRCSGKSMEHDDGGDALRQSAACGQGQPDAIETPLGAGERREVGLVVERDSLAERFIDEDDRGQVLGRRDNVSRSGSKARGDVPGVRPRGPPAL